MRSRRLRLLAVLTLALAAGCDEQKHIAGKSSAPPPAPKAEEDPFIVGRKTNDIKNADEELAKGAVEGSTKIVAKDPITLSANAYVSMIGQISILHIQHAMDLYKAANDRLPKNYDEFMAEIIKPNNIVLPELPYYQKYGYDEKEHRLIILEYPDLKNQVQR